MIKYRLHQDNRSNREDKGKWFARTVTDGVMSTEDLIKHMATHGTPYTEGTIRGVVMDMINCIRELSLDGKAVKLEDLAIFSLGIETTGADSPQHWNPKEHIKRVYMKARATGDFRTAAIKNDARFTELRKYDVETEESEPGA